MPFHPRDHQFRNGDKPAVIMAGSKEQLTYSELEARANQAAHLFRTAGCEPGDVVAFSLENCLDVFVFSWGAQRAGLLFVAVSTHLTEDEISYVIEDSGAKLFLSSPVIGEQAFDMLPARNPGLLYYTTRGAGAGWQQWQAALDKQPVAPIASECRGIDMLYSSGTTGRPKGIAPKLPENEAIDAPEPISQLAQSKFGAGPETIYLSPAPLYHAAPLRWTMAIQRLGGTVLVMEKFDAEAILRLIDEYKVTMAQFVPTHFVRMLDLNDTARSAYDLSSLKTVIHAAAPCPPDIKRAMIEWLGPILIEYYGGSENNGITMITSQEWLDHPGSVGRAILGTPHICDDDGEPLPPGEAGMVYFEGGPEFRYHNDPEKTRNAYNRYGWSTLGDVGQLDNEGYLYLTDRKSFMIISGGVNIYPQEVENHLLSHAFVRDVAVVGGPDARMGEKVVAIVELQSDVAEMSDSEYAATLDAFCRAALSGVKVPRQYIFSKNIERTETGKLMKRKIRDRLWADS